MTACQPRLTDDGELVAANPEGRPHGAGRQQVARIEQCLRGCREAVFHPGDERPQAGAVEHTVLDKIQRQMNVAGIEDFEFRFDACLADDVSHAADIAWRIDHHLCAGIHRIQVKAADIGLERRDMFDALFRTQERRTGAGNPWIVLAGYEASTGTCGQVDDEFLVSGANQLDDFAV